MKIFNNIVKDKVKQFLAKEVNNNFTKITLVAFIRYLYSQHIKKGTVLWRKINIVWALFRQRLPCFVAQLFCYMLGTQSLMLNLLLPGKNIF